MNEVMHILKQYNCTIFKNEIQLFCEIETGIPKYRLTEALYALGKYSTPGDKKNMNSYFENLSLTAISLLPFLYL